MNMNLANIMGINQPTTIYNTPTINTDKKTSSSNTFQDSLEESVVDSFKRRRPDCARHVDQQVRAGRAVKERNGVSNLSTADMTMEEYQAYFYGLLETIPYDSTRVNDTSIITISEAGWEQMRKDPDYESWILGYFVEDRSVRNPFFGWGNDAGSMITEHFGASIEEHHGEGFSKAACKGDSDKDNDDDEEEDWWIKRHKRMKKLMREQVERTMKRDAAGKAAAKEEYARQQYLSRQRQHSFLTASATDANDIIKPDVKDIAASMAAAAYVNTIDLFGTGMIGDVH